MNNLLQPHATVPPVRKVAAGEDLFGEERVAAGSLAFKVVPSDPNGLFICEMTFHQKGGPARHLHHYQDEWFYAIEGEFIMEIRTGKDAAQPRRFNSCPTRNTPCLGIRQ